MNNLKTKDIINLRKLCLYGYGNSFVYKKEDKMDKKYYVKVRGTDLFFDERDTFSKHRKGFSLEGAFEKIQDLSKEGIYNLEAVEIVTEYRPVKDPSAPVARHIEHEEGNRG